MCHECSLNTFTIDRVFVLLFLQDAWPDVEHVFSICSLCCFDMFVWCCKKPISVCFRNLVLFNCCFTYVSAWFCGIVYFWFSKLLRLVMLVHTCYQACQTLLTHWAGRATNSSNIHVSCDCKCWCVSCDFVWWRLSSTIVNIGCQFAWCVLSSFVGVWLMLFAGSLDLCMFDAVWCWRSTPAFWCNAKS